MTDTTTAPARAQRRAKVSGARVIWARGIEVRYGISSVTRWRWERSGRLPPRDVHVGDQSGWRPETIERHEAGA